MVNQRKILQKRKSVLCSYECLFILYLYNYQNATSIANKKKKLFYRNQDKSTYVIIVKVRKNSKQILSQISHTYIYIYLILLILNNRITILK
jgi:predicted RNase H-like nuclease